MAFEWSGIWVKKSANHLQEGVEAGLTMPNLDDDLALAFLHASDQLFGFVVLVLQASVLTLQTQRIPHVPRVRASLCQTRVLAVDRVLLLIRKRRLEETRGKRVCT